MPLDFHDDPAPDADFDPLASLAPEPAAAKPKTKTELRAEAKVMKKIVENAEKLTPEEIQAHQLMCLKLNRVFNDDLFGDMIKAAGLKMTPSEMKGATKEELQEHFQRCMVVIDSAGSSNCIQEIASFGLVAIEGAAAMIPLVKKHYDITGLAEELKSDKNYHLILRQMELQYDMGSRISVEKRLIFTIYQSAQAVMMRNRGIAALDAMAEQANQNIAAATVNQPVAPVAVEQAPTAAQPQPASVPITALVPGAFFEPTIQPVPK